MRRLSRKLIGKIVYVRFLDHVENLPEPAVAEAVGWLVGYNKKEFHICSWRYPKFDDHSQETHYRIIRSTVESIELVS